MKRALFLTIAALGISAAAFADEAADGIAREKAGTAAINAVTVYPDGALVTRTAHVAIPAGPSIVVFEDLTPNLDDASLRAHGSAGVKVTGISAEWQGNVEPPREAVARLTDAIEKLDVESRAEQDKQQRLAFRKQVLEQYRALSRQTIGEAAGDAQKASAADKAKWAAAVAFLSKEEAAIAVDTAASEQRLEEIDEKGEALNAELDKLHANADRRSRRVEVEVESQSGSDATIVLEYVVSGASWVPAYDARQTSNGISLTAFGTVTQATGEDWKQVALTLSTARPADGAQVPRLGPAFLSGSMRPKEPVQIVSYGKQKSQNFQAAVDKVEPSPQPMSAHVDDHGSAVVFRIDGKETLPADQRPHRVEIATQPLKAVVSWETVPKIAPFVYLKATAKNAATFPLLAGEVNVFRTSGFIGTSHLEYVAPNEEFSLSLGSDEDLRVRRVIDERVDTKPKLLGSTRTIAYGYTIELSNFKDAAQTVTLVENVPVTQRKEIKIDIREGTSKPDERDSDGFLKWHVELKPGETRAVEFGYLLEYPKDFEIGGL